MTRQHYHVMISIPGCMPDTNDIYTSKRDALADALNHVNDMRQSWESPEYRETWRGSKDAGLWTRADGMYYVSVDACQDDCESESDF